MARAELKSGRAPSQPLERPKIADGSSLSWKPSRLLQDLAIRHISIVPSAGVSARPRPTCSVAGRSGTASNRAASGRRKPCGCRGLNLVWDFSRSSTNFATHSTFHLPRAFGQASASSASGAAHPTRRCRPRRRMTADKKIRGEPAMTWRSCRHNLVFGGCSRFFREHPNHDAAVRISGEAPRRRAHSLPRHERPWATAGHRHLGSSWRCIAPKPMSAEPMQVSSARLPAIPVRPMGSSRRPQLGTRRHLAGGHHSATAR